MCMVREVLQQVDGNSSTFTNQDVLQGTSERLRQEGGHTQSSSAGWSAFA